MTTLGGLAVVITLILTTAYLFRKHAPVAVKILPAEAVQVLGRRFLDHKHCIQLVRCGSRILVLASSPQHGLSTLSEITDPVEVDLLAGLCRQEAPDSITNQFGQILGRFQDPGRRSLAGRAATHAADDENPFENLTELEDSSRPEPARGTMHG